MNSRQKILPILFISAHVALLGCGESADPQGESSTSGSSSVGSGESGGEGGPTGTEAEADSGTESEADAGSGESVGTTETGTTETSTTGSAETSEADSGDGDGDGDGSFVNDTTGDDSCGVVCDIWSPGDCGEGKKCTAVICALGSGAWDSDRCRDIQGSQTVGDECERTGDAGDDTCEEGAMCWDVDADTGLGTCVAYCTGTEEAPQCEVGKTCAILNDGVLPLCLAGCDPLAQDCEGNDLCVPVQDGYVCAVNASNDMAPYGTPCMYANVCNAGLVCLNSAAVPEPECANASGCCSPMCDLGEPNMCPGDGQLCEPIFDEDQAPPGFDHVGACAVPQG